LFLLFLLTLFSIGPLGESLFPIGLENFVGEPLTISLMTLNVNMKEKSAVHQDGSIKQLVKSGQRYNHPSRETVPDKL
jgi:hypothetical protein